MVAQATTFQSCMLDPTQHINGLCDGDLDTARTFSMSARARFPRRSSRRAGQERGL